MIFYHKEAHNAIQILSITLQVLMLEVDQSQIIQVALLQWPTLLTNSSTTHSRPLTTK